MRRAAVVTVILCVTLDAVFGILFSAAQHVSTGNGLYFATVTASTVGYGDITPHGWAPHVIAVLMMLTVIPLFSALFSILTTFLTAKHVDSRHDKLIAHIDRRHAEMAEHVKKVHNGRSGSSPGFDSKSGSREHAAVPGDLGGVPGYGQPADAPGDPESPGS
jgi:phosphate/sulfate permease